MKTVWIKTSFYTAYDVEEEKIKGLDNGQIIDLISRMPEEEYSGKIEVELDSIE
jgi:hypothetical protein